MKRKMAAILAADVVSFSRLIAEDEEETLQRLAAYRGVFDDFVVRHAGRVFNTAGDSIMCEFESAVEAVHAAIDIQESLRSRNLAYPPNRWLQFRIGISVGDVVERGGDLLGTAVNIAARLENLAGPGGICISRTVYDAISSKLSVSFVDLGERRVKNIPAPVHAFAIAWPGTALPAERPDPVPLVRRAPVLWAAGACAAALAIAGAVALGHRLAMPSQPSLPMALVEKSRSGTSEPSQASEALQASSLSADPVAAFAQLTQRGGIVEDPKTAPGLYYKALLLEAKGLTLAAHHTYYNLARMGLDFIDPHLRYAALVRVQEGRAIARQVYAELQEDVPTRATALIHALQFEGAERQTRINALIGAHPDFAPAYYFLAEEHSEDRMGNTQTLRDKQIEFAALAEFLKADREGRLGAFFLDRHVVAEWLDRARKRHTMLEAFLKNATASPVISFTRANTGWMASVSTPEIATAISYRIGEEGGFRATGHLQALDPRTGRLVPNPSFELPAEQKETTIFIRYADSTGREQGPFPLPFNPRQALQTAQRDVLERMPGAWIAFREARLYYTHLVSYRCGIAKVVMGIDNGPLDREVSLPDCNERDPFAIGNDVKPYLSLPEEAQSVAVQLTYADGTRSEVRRFARH